MGHPHINDLAYMPAENDAGEFGYNLLVGGFFSATKRAEAIPLDAWVPEDQVIHACDAILTTFRDFGKRSARQKCRMMWLIDDMGLENFRDEVRKRMPNGVLQSEGRDLVDTTWKRRESTTECTSKSKRASTLLESTFQWEEFKQKTCLKWLGWPRSTVPGK